MAQLNITYAGQTTTHRLPDAVGTEFTIGRAEDNSLPVPDSESLSASHCRIIKTEDGFAIQDLQSTNGVFLGERQVDYELMLPNETYKAGTLEIVLIENEPAPATAATGTAAPRVVRKKKTVAPARKAAPKSTMDIAALAEQYKRNEGLSGADIAYIAVVLIAALYAGMALYSWQHDGNPLPIFFRG